MPPLERLRAAVRFEPLEIVVLVVLGALVVGGATLAWVRSRPVPIALEPSTLVSVEPTASLASGSIWVHVVGSVRSPGVYRLASDARAIDAVRAAGGLGPHADVAAVNLARTLTDGEQLVVPRRSRPANPTPGSASAIEPSSGLVNLNTADQAELETLPGIGPALAQRIIEYREANGPFRTTRDLLEVRGIGEKTLANLEPHVIV